MERPGTILSIQVVSNVQAANAVYVNARNGFERRRFIAKYKSDMRPHQRDRRQFVPSLFTGLLFLFFLLTPVAYLAFLSLPFFAWFLQASAGSLDGATYKREYEETYLQYLKLKRTPDEEKLYTDPYFKAAFELIKQIQDLNCLINEWNVYVTRYYDLQVIEQDEQLDALYPVLVRSRRTIIREMRRLSELMVIREENKKSSTRRHTPVDLTDMRQCLEEVSVVIAASVKTNQEMGAVDGEGSSSVIRATAEFDAIQLDLGNELPEVRREKYRRLAAKRAAGQPS